MTMILAAGETASFADRMGRAGLNTLLGMGMAFFVLILVMFVIMLFPLFFREKKKPSQTRAELAEKAIDNTISQIEEHEAQDDSELVAVIAAAIAAYEGSSADGVVIRSIRRRGARKQWQRA
ncbi:MAG: OadG family protein [Lachnospiraceae bacterium]|jgi:sodium pump decarboxylase gamma subunit|nr:OadG family protein [Lachnospiraceae bacterium]